MAGSTFPCSTFKGRRGCSYDKVSPVWSSYLLWALHLLLPHVEDDLEQVFEINHQGLRLRGDKSSADWHLMVGSQPHRAQQYSHSALVSSQVIKSVTFNWIYFFTTGTTVSNFIITPAELITSRLTSSWWYGRLCLLFSFQVAAVRLRTAV